MLTGLASCTSDRLSSFTFASSRLAGVVGLFIFGFSTFSVQAAEPRWPDGPYRYITVDQSVRDALIELGRNMGLTVRVSDQVKGRLSGSMPAGTAKTFLDELCSRYGLVWHFDGLVLNVATEAEVRNETIPLDANTAAGAEEKLNRLGVIDPRFSLKVSQQDDVVQVAGPPSYVDLIRKTLGVSAKQSAQKAVSVRVFRGRQAEAQIVPAEKPKQGQEAR
ncbi:MAG TPA: type III secretion protein [Mesorhizobium sp.]|jgi:type III secretion protein C|uniref:type III secretion protein n=1 Tax=Mesorhizobium sp. TaxID=1871066 RepID=UPI002DDD769F|nr:type III secretion protein [Mesorhizobium sp.]HEV2503937.1 type III secretion protein [Mesorhizobium sp.]